MDVATQQGVAARQNYPALFRLFIANGLASVGAEVSAERWQQASHGQKEAAATRALHLLHFVLAAPDLWDQTSALLLALSPHMDKQGRWSEWLPYLQEGSRLARRIGDARGAALLDMWAGVIHRSMGRYGDARAVLQGCATEFAALGDDFQRARALNLLAWTERLAGDLSEAQRLANDALPYLAGDDGDAPLERARSYSILGAVCYDLGDPSQAEAYYRKTLLVPQLRTDGERLAWGHGDLGLALSAQGKYQEALESYHAALAALGDAPGSVQAGVLQMNLAVLYLEVQRPAEALACCIQAQEVFRRVHDGRRLTMVEINLGIAYRQLGRFHSAEQALMAAGERAGLLDQPYMRVNALEQLGLVYLGRGDGDRALSILRTALDQLEPLEPSPLRRRHAEALAHHLQQAQAATRDQERAAVSKPST